jgi:superfamily II DNA or RNA helicase
MNVKELHEKYQALLIENNRLRKEIEGLKAQMGIREQQGIYDHKDAVHPSFPKHTSEAEISIQKSDGQALSSFPTANRRSSPSEKIKLFMSLFRGQNDVYAKRWENSQKGTSGYSPACANEWKPGVCQKPKIKCSDCTYKNYLVPDEKVVNGHLRSYNNFVAGIYPLLPDDTCYFLAIDFDDEGWQKDIVTLREVCSEFNIPIAVERSRSGNGAHAWFFFEYPIAASLARKFGSAMLTYAMSRRHEITFKSYDRFFPNQDTLPKGGFGNLIALPLQKVARENNNSVFIDELFRPYDDQWSFLASIQRLTEKDIEMLISKLCQGNELGILKNDEEESPKPWEPNKIKLQKSDFPENIEVVKANMLFIPKTGISQRALNHLKRLAAFKNPEFYKAQAMRLPTYNKPRIVSCADETAMYLCLPRGCEADLKALFEDMGAEVCWLDKTNPGRKIDIEFNGTLRDEQPLALDKLLEHRNGILCGTTAFGKTVVAIKLIAKRKVNTLILVDKVSLVSQWKERLTQFLTTKEKFIPTAGGSNNRVKKPTTIRDNLVIGQIGNGKNTLNGSIDIAVMQSLNRMGDVKDCVNDYGMVIVDECHHVSAFSFEKILKSTTAKYVHGLTATTVRKDGHHPIIFMQCGPVRFKDDAKKQAEKRPFDHYIIPKFTSFRIPLDKDEKDLSINELYAGITMNEMRNQLIIDDVVKCHENGRNCIVLTERTAHVETLSNGLRKRIPDVISLTGGMGTKETRKNMTRIANTPVDQSLTLIATGRYIGEGFDEPRLDTLFLAMPISWKGTLQQYAGRLHRLFEGKSDVRIYDYVDIHVRMFEKMYNKRLNGYGSIGYKTKGENIAAESIDIIFDKSSFLPVFSTDIANAVSEVLIVSPFVTRKRTLLMRQNLETAIESGVKVTVVTRPAEDFMGIHAFGKGKDLTTLQNTLDLLKRIGISIILKTNIHQKFAIMDQRVVWYGSINLLSFGNAEESMMRLESPNIANELIKSIEI